MLWLIDRAAAVVLLVAAAVLLGACHGPIQNLDLCAAVGVSLEIGCNETHTS